MKVTRKLLRSLISEEIDNLEYKRTKNVKETISNSKLASEIKTYEDAWAGGDNIHINADHLKDYGSKEKSVLGLEILNQGTNINETRDVTMQLIKKAVKLLDTVDPRIIATHLGAHEDEVDSLLKDHFADTSPDHDQQLNVGMFSNENPPVGGGLGRGQALAEENLKNALADLYQEVVDAEEDEIDPSDYSIGTSMDMMGDANFKAERLIQMIVDNFLQGKGTSRQ